jgi:hypothetical protein
VEVKGLARTVQVMQVGPVLALMVVKQRLDGLRKAR